jgi:hypothetical protein
MKSLAVPCAVALGLTLIAELRADGLCPSCGRAPLGSQAPRAGHAPWGVHEPWHNMILARDKYRGRAPVQSFWNDYYRNLSVYYGLVANMDWASYYKHHGTPIGSVPGRCGGPSSMQMAPMLLVPQIPYDSTQIPYAPWSPPRVPWGNTYAPDMSCPTCQ